MLSNFFYLRGVCWVVCSQCDWSSEHEAQAWAWLGQGVQSQCWCRRYLSSWMKNSTNEAHVSQCLIQLISLESKTCHSLHCSARKHCNLSLFSWKFCSNISPEFYHWQSLCLSVGLCVRLVTWETNGLDETIRATNYCHFTLRVGSHLLGHTQTPPDWERRWLWPVPAVQAVLAPHDQSFVSQSNFKILFLTRTLIVGGSDQCVRESSLTACVWLRFSKSF